MLRTRTILWPSSNIICKRFCLLGLFGSDFEWQSNSLYCFMLNWEQFPSKQSPYRGLQTISVLHWDENILLVSNAAIRFLVFNSSCTLHFEVWVSNLKLKTSSLKTRLFFFLIFSLDTDTGLFLDHFPSLNKLLASWLITPEEPRSFTWKMRIAWLF